MESTKRADGRQSRVCWFAALVPVIVLLAAPGARADYVPGIGDWEHYHHSLDETPIAVVFVHDFGKRDFPVLTIPAAISISRMECRRALTDRFRSP